MMGRFKNLSYCHVTKDFKKLCKKFINAEYLHILNIQQLTLETWFESLRRLIINNKLK